MLGELPTILRARNGARPVLLGLAALRGVLAVAAIPLAPLLYDDHVALLVLLRPAKEVLLLAGDAVLEGDENVAVVVAAAIPLHLLAVWVFYLLGRAYGDDLERADLPGIAGRVLPRRRIRDLSDTLAERGWTLVFFGRLAIMPSTLVAAAAGAADVPARTFVVADTAGAALAMAAMLLTGYALGEAYEQAGPWFTAAGAAIVLGLLVLLGRTLSRGGRGRAAASRGS